MPIMCRTGTLPLLVVGPPLFVLGFKHLIDVSVTNDYYTYSSRVPEDVRIILLEFSPDVPDYSYRPKPLESGDRIIRFTINADEILPKQFLYLHAFIQLLFEDSEGDVKDDWY